MRSLTFLVGKYFYCIFDHDAGKYDTKKPHYHEIVNANWCNYPGDAHHGLELFLDLDRWSPVYLGPVYIGNGEDGFQYIYEKADEEYRPFERESRNLWNKRRQSATY